MSTTAQTIDPASMLSERFRAAIADAFPDAAGADPLITASRQPTLGDFQSNAAMPLAKRVGAKPRDVAAQIVERLDLTGVAESVGVEDIAGPGFINVRLLPDTLARCIERLDDEHLGIGPPDRPETVVVDLCGVNLAKQMHVGHLRSTVIGDAVARLFERLGHTVVRQSHVGDWGLPIAMVVQKLIEREDEGGGGPERMSLDELDDIYRAAQAECRPERRARELIARVGGHPKAEAELAGRIEHAEDATERAKQRLVLLQSGDERSVATWRQIYAVTMAACLATCARLHANVTEEDSAGESTYRDELGEIVADLEERGVAETSDGALVVRVPGIAEPCLIRKRDGGYLYATTDLAAIRRRVQRLHGDRVIYCVDSRQSLHFRLVFGAAHVAGYDLRDGARAPLEHAAFGSVLGEDGKPLKTRSGENVRLTALLDEAVERASRTVAEKNPAMGASDRERIAEAVAMAAIKYADLSTERIKDYVFSFDRMLAFEGDTGPYLLNAVVRIHSIFRRASDEGIDVEVARRSPLLLAEPHEKALALALLRYPETVRGAAETLEPNRLCNYLFELARAYTGFYENCPVLRADDATRNARLRLCHVTARVLEDGLRSLGIPIVDRM